MKTIDFFDLYRAKSTPQRRVHLISVVVACMFLLIAATRAGALPRLLPVDTESGSTNPYGWLDDGTVVRLNDIGDSVGIGIVSPAGKLQVVGGNALFDGNVGIGTTAPGTKLQIEGGTPGGGATDLVTILHPSANISGDGPAINFAARYLSNPWKYARIKAINNGDGLFGADLVFEAKPGNGQPGSLAEAMRITGAGNVGIGTTSPGAKLHLYSNAVSGTPELRIEGYGTANGIIAFRGNEHANNAVGLRYISTSDSIGDLAFYANSVSSATLSERMRILGSGNVGIGMTNPGAMLDVAGTLNASGNVSFGSNVSWAGSLTGGTVPWARLGSFPSGCPIGQFAYSIGGSLGCRRTGTGTPIVFEGSDAGDDFLTVDGVDVYRHNVFDPDGLTLTRIAVLDHSVLSSTNYNICDSVNGATASDNLATALGNTDSLVIGVITSHECWRTNVTTNLKTALRRIGLNKALKLSDSYPLSGSPPYAAIFQGQEIPPSYEPSAHAVEVTNSYGGHPHLEGWLGNRTFNMASPAETNVLYNPAGNAAVVFVDMNSNVGIGTSSPTTRLDVQGEAKISGISFDGTGRAVCIKSDRALGTCSTTVAINGTCGCN